jgi:hypothetical protein
MTLVVGWGGANGDTGVPPFLTGSHSFYESQSSPRVGSCSFLGRHLSLLTGSQSFLERCSSLFAGSRLFLHRRSFCIQHKSSTLDSWGRSFRKWWVLPQRQHISCQLYFCSIAGDCLFKNILTVVCLTVEGVLAAVFAASSSRA